MEPENGNGNGRLVLWKWIAVTMTGLLFAGVSSWAAFMMGKDGALQRQISEVHERNGYLNQRFVGMEATLTLFQTQLNRIEMRLDQVLTNPGPSRQRSQ